MRCSTVLIVCGVIAGLPAEADCKTRTWPCYWTHGRIVAGNGTPSVRIWPSGTRRLLGVVNPSDPRTDDGELDSLPIGLGRLLTDKHVDAVWGDFHVCPVAPERDGWMRFVTVNRTRKLVIQPT